jgi:hypothetical protein
LNNIANCFIVNLLIKQLFVVLSKLIDSAIGHKVVVLVGHHALVEEMRNPLSDVKLVLNAFFGTKLKNTIN